MSSSSECSSSPAPTKKRKQTESKASENSDSEDAKSANEEDSVVPQPLPPTDDIVLSHAERRRQKKRQKQDQLAEASPRKKRKLDDGITSTPPPSDVHVNANARPKSKSKDKTGSTAKATPSVEDPRRSRRQNSVWVGNLSFRTTQDAIRGFFDGVGTITRVHMPMRRGKQVPDENMGFAYVDFDSPEAKMIAITLSEGQLEGRNLLIKDGDDFTGRPSEGVSTGGKKVTEIASMPGGKSLSKTAQKILRAQKQPPAPTLFLGNLGFETTEESIRELFEAHRYWRYKSKGKGVDVEAEKEGDEEDGEGKPKDAWIRKIRMGTFEDSGNCKGFAFVDFTSIEHATEALVHPRNHRLNGRDLVVEYASPDAVRRGGGGPRNTKDNQDRLESKNPQKGSAKTPYTKQRRPRHTEQLGEGDRNVGETEATATETTKSSRLGRPDRAGHDQPHTRRRARPGAALAHAQRQSAAILPGQGQKIVF